MVGIIVLVIGIAIGFFVYTTYLSNLAKERESSLFTHITAEGGRKSYRNLFEVQDDFGYNIGELLPMAVGTFNAVDAATFSVPGRKYDKTAIVGGTPCGTEVNYPWLCCLEITDKSAETVVFTAKAQYDSTYDVTEYELLHYVQCYLIPKNFYPVFGNNYKVTTRIGDGQIETGNTEYTGTSGQSFYLAAPAGNDETLVEVTIVGEIE